MVVAQIGLNLGVIGHHIYGAIVFLSVATTLIAPPLLKLAAPRQLRWNRKWFAWVELGA
jgi:Kef-type K+ transport system membrane component KefB